MAMTAGGCATGGPVPGPAPSFNCQVQGAELLAPPSDQATVCRRFRAALEKALGQPEGFLGRAAAGGTGDALQVRLTIRRLGTVSAQVTQTRAGRTVTHPQMEFGVSDRELRLSDLVHLADEVARHIR